MMENNITICFLPGRESSYSRTRVLLRGMKEAGLNVLDCSVQAKNPLRYFGSFIKFLKNKGKSDVIFVGFLGQFLMPFVKLFTRKKILFDAFVSVYQTMTFDRKAFNPNGLFSRSARFIDRYSYKLADKVFLDTQQHINFFIDEYHLSKAKVERLLVGSDDSIMHPREKEANSDFIVHFHGEFQALHGSGYIIEAARLLPDIKFQIIGKGRELNVCMEKANDLDNVVFYPCTTYEEISKYISKADVCLGIFGNTQKTQLVIPHKAYEALACRKPLITADTPAARELLTNEGNAILCKTADPASLAEAIKRLKDDKQLREKIANNGYDLFIRKCTPRVLGEQIKENAELLLNAQ